MARAKPAVVMFSTASPAFGQALLHALLLLGAPFPQHVIHLLTLPKLRTNPKPAAESTSLFPSTCWRSLRPLWPPSLPFGPEAGGCQKANSGRL